MAAITTPSSGSKSLQGTGDIKPTVYRILFAIGLVHLLNDSIQSVIPAIFPILKSEMGLSYTQVGWVQFAINFTASIMQPVVGIYTDRKPSPYMLPIGMASTLVGMLLLAFAHSYWVVLLSVCFVGLGSAAFHPEGSRVSHMAAGGRKGLAQSIFQVGGNFGQSLAPVMTKWIFIPLGLFGSIWFTGVAAVAIAVQLFIARWYKSMLVTAPVKAKSVVKRAVNPAHRKRVMFAIYVLIFLVFIRSWYGAAMSGYFAFFLHDTYGMSINRAQDFIFLFLAAGAVGTFFGGPLADRFGKRNVIFFSMLGSAPFALLLPHVGMTWSYILLVVIGVILLSSFSVTVVYAQMLFPGKVGTVSGLITGLAFGLGGIGSVVLGNLCDIFGTTRVMELCAFLPLLGILTFLLPTDRKLREWTEEQI
ncbi:MFS transporter [Paenibacillus aceris]|uniref:FSR family fosmidomycin resistance protein-like MFS transporter n=1 Tax=Paenibacillus aceris TaxID=869555 RepID=A0ABS4I7P5_9BACL|nr:MFS transporter [Paenibacillus aceris]MBP1966947.1 FSR family fosmidomycin resistance protein-like MFS transporter [Paenibacillus aceris]NHW39311.1 MFS transporter [Paenibacillus aceris]